MGVRKLNFGLPLVARKTVCVYRVFWAKIKTKASKENTYKIKTKFFFFLFIYLFIIIIILLLLLFRQSKKTKEKNFLFFYFFYIIFFYLFLKKTNYYYLFYYLFSRTKLGDDSCPSLLRFCLII